MRWFTVDCESLKRATTLLRTVLPGKGKHPPSNRQVVVESNYDTVEFATYNHLPLRIVIQTDNVTVPRLRAVVRMEDLLAVRRHCCRGSKLTALVPVDKDGWGEATLPFRSEQGSKSITAFTGVYADDVSHHTVPRLWWESYFQVEKPRLLAVLLDCLLKQPAEASLSMGLDVAGQCIRLAADGRCLGRCKAAIVGEPRAIDNWGLSRGFLLALRCILDNKPGVMHIALRESFDGSKHMAVSAFSDIPVERIDLCQVGLPATGG